MIKNIIFDIGNVLVDFRWADFLAERGFSPEMTARIADASVHNALWNELDRGVMQYADVIEEFAQADPEIADDIRRAFRDLKRIVAIRSYTIPWIRSLRARGYHVYYLSNWPEQAYLDCQDALAFLPETEGGVFSFQEKVIKPDPEIYRRLFARFGLEPGKCVFLDDSPKNIEAAQALGMHGIVFETEAQAAAALEALLEA